MGCTSRKGDAVDAAVVVYWDFFSFARSSLSSPFVRVLIVLFDWETQRERAVERLLHSSTRKKRLLSHEQFFSSSLFTSHRIPCSTTVSRFSFSKKKH